MSAPRGINPAHWSEVVADALRLASVGWAASAIGLGWSELDLFGAVTDPVRDPAGGGLAVRLAGRRVLAMSPSFATIADADGGRTWHHPTTAEGAVLLWEAGCGA